MVDQTIHSAFNKIYDATKRKTLIYITSKCRNPDDISDIFQETYAELFSVLSKRGEHYIKNEEAFVIKIANQKIYRFYTIFEKLKSIISITQENNEGNIFELPDINSTEISIEDKIINSELVEDIHSYLKDKSPDIRRIFYLYYSLELTIGEIALELEISESNVKNKLYRTLADLRNKFNLRSDS